MIYECNYCGYFFSEPVQENDKQSQSEIKNYCPYCMSDDLNYYSSLFEYNGRYYRNKMQVAHNLEKMGYTDEQIEKELLKVREIWQI